MIGFNYTLVAEGSSDAVLLPIIDWIWKQYPQFAPTSRFFDPGRCGLSRGTLQEKIRHALDIFPRDVLLVHRDADTAGIPAREQEIQAAMADSGHKPFVCVIPVRATEAWLLCNEKAIRTAAGNPNGKERINLPLPAKCEELPDPKEVLFKTLRAACGLRGRRLKKFSEFRARARIAELIEDFSPLRELSAFQKLEADMGAVLKNLICSGFVDTSAERFIS